LSYLLDYKVLLSPAMCRVNHKNTTGPIPD
jgi:hypothetical protein